MSMEYIRRAYGVPAKRGARVEFCWPEGSSRPGTIVGSRGARLRIRLDGDNYVGNYHPLWKLRFPDANAKDQQQ